MTQMPMPARPHFGRHDLEGGERHHEQVLKGAVFTFTDQSGAGQDDRQHGQRADDLHDASEPDAVQVGIELHACGQRDRQRDPGPMALDELVDLPSCNALDVVRTDEGLRHPCCIDVNLNRGLLPSEDIFLKVRRDIEHERVVSRVKARINLGHRDHAGWFEIGRIEGTDDTRGERRPILVNDRDRCVMELAGRSRRRRVDRHRETEEDENQ